MHELLISTRKGLFVAESHGDAFALARASTDRGDSWQVVSNHLPPVHAVTFV